MGRITNQYFGEGQAPTAAQLNAVYDSVATDDVEDVNLDTEWAQRNHFSTSNSITSLYTFDYDGTADWNTTSTTFTTIENVGPNKSKVTPNYSTHGHAVVRVHATGLVAEATLNSNDGNGTAGQTQNNTYAFRLLMSLNSSGTPSTEVVAQCTYSFTTKAAITTEPTATTLNLNYRNFSISGLFYLAAGNVIDSVELQACVGLTNNSIDIQHNHIQVIIVEN
tara:strand:+ start:12463 stop:13128 length:666 start_codon:yes stop_codon:yes gene_type:complete